MLPPFATSGRLPPGKHEATVPDFIDKFCSNNERKRYLGAFLALVQFATNAGAQDLLIGGSFVSSKPEPNDLDCVVVLERDSQIPEERKSIKLEGLTVDVFYCSAEQKEILASFVKLFSHSKDGSEAGFVIVHLRSEGALLWDPHRQPDERIFQAVRSTYGYRHFIERQPHQKTLVTIHGIRTQAEWNSEVSLIASLNGWVVAPFQYGYVDVDVFMNRYQRNEIVDRFRDHVFELSHSFDLKNISIIAHSFGTYIITRYLLGFDDPPVQFDTVILCGAIIDPYLDIERFRKRAGIICNEVAPNDEWASWAKVANFGVDEFFGDAATAGFKTRSERLIQRSAQIFTHNNVIRRDVVVQRWMPILELNVGAIQRERDAK